MANDKATQTPSWEDAKEERRVVAEDESHSIPQIDHLLYLRTDLSALHVKLTLVNMSIKPGAALEHYGPEIHKSLEAVEKLLPKLNQGLPKSYRAREQLLDEACECLAVEDRIDDILEKFAVADQKAE
ncbi:hypothetical protein HJFPF1_10200 [Paramyrothecium foliicola]|nr:hypothetical protein HJFPF1_10200 [Paramyrothecium foliicola]